MPPLLRTTHTLKGYSHPRWVGAVGALLSLIGIVGLFAGIDAVRADPLKGQQAALGFAAFVVFMVLVGLVSHFNKRELIVNEEGIQTTSRAGEVVTIRWNEPHDTYLRDLGIGHTGVHFSGRANVRTADGRHIELVDVRLPGDPNGAINDAVRGFSTAGNWARLQPQVEAGAVLRFGPVELQQDCVAVGLIRHPLSPPPRLEIIHGKLHVRGATQLLRSDVWLREVPNYNVLLEALRVRTLRLLT